MRVLLVLLKKEFIQIFRDPAILRIIFIVPVFQLLILPWAADYEIKNIQIAVVDHDHSMLSRQLTDKITASGYFQLAQYGNSVRDAYAVIEDNKADLLLEIPVGFERKLVREDEVEVFMALNAIQGAKASLGSAYLSEILQKFNAGFRKEWLGKPDLGDFQQVSVISANWFNPNLNYQYFMVPGILVILVTMVGTFLASLNIVREKEIGTIEQINVTPLKKYQFILGKLIPFWILGMIVLGLGMLVAWIVYGIIPAGSLLLIFLFAGVYLLAVLGLGLLISTLASNQHQAVLISFFFMMLFVLLGGLFTPIESMPVWGQWIAAINPVTYFIEVMRMVVMKGSGMADISRHFLIIGGFAVVLNSLALLNYRKQG